MDDEMQAQLREWSIEFDTSIPEFGGFTEPTKEYAGRCKHRTDDNGIRYGIILIRPELENHPFLARSVLWHEFAHHAVWYFDGTKGHGGKWFKWNCKKPLMVMGQFVSVLYLAYVA